MAEHRVVHYKLAPALAAYFAWLDADPRRTFNVAQYDLFVANWTDPTDAVAYVRAEHWRGLDEPSGVDEE